MRYCPFSFYIRFPIHNQMSMFAFSRQNTWLSQKTNTLEKMKHLFATLNVLKSLTTQKNLFITTFCVNYQSYFRFICYSIFYVGIQFVTLRTDKFYVPIWKYIFVMMQQKPDAQLNVYWKISFLCCRKVGRLGKQIQNFMLPHVILLYMQICL